MYSITLKRNVPNKERCNFLFVDILMIIQLFYRADPLLTLTILSSKIRKTAVTQFNVIRLNVWQSTIRKLKKDFVPFDDLLIRFSDCFGNGRGHWSRWPKRRIIRSLDGSNPNSSLFEASLKSKFLSWNKKGYWYQSYYINSVKHTNLKHFQFRRS